MPKIPRPPGHHTIVPGFAVPNAAKVVTFLEKAFGAKLIEKYDGPGGTIAHCEMHLGDSAVMFGDAGGQMPAMPASLSFYVDDGPAVDATYKKAIASGATSLMEPKDQFYGYRSATVRDPGGNQWTICAIVEKLTPQEIEKRMAQMMKGS